MNPLYTTLLLRSKNHSYTTVRISFTIINYRSLLNHNAVLAADHILWYGNHSGDILEYRDKFPVLNLVSFLERSEQAVNLFVKKDSDFFEASKQYNNIKKKQLLKPEN